MEKNKNGKSLEQLAEELMPVLAEFMTHPDIPVRLYNSLHSALVDFEIAYSDDLFRMRKLFPLLCHRAASDPEGADAHILPLHTRKRRRANAA